MQLNVRLTGKLMLIAVSVVVVLLLFLAFRTFFRKEATVNEQRLAHVQYIVRLLEAYYQQHGSYPQPTAREETIEGFRHSWGYRLDVPALASCTIVTGDDDTPDPLRSVCGGNIYDANGRVIGWKGTLTAQSALNSVEVAMKGGGRISMPLSSLVENVPLDPSFAPYPALREMGFGEYVYAVRAPADGAIGKGGQAYQIAVTVPDEKTGVLRTFIQGDYFVRSDEKEIMPSSLIGPGLLLDRFGNPLPGQDRPLHVLLDAQAYGYPNPLIGEGETVIAWLTIRRRARVLQEAVDARLAIFQELSTAASMQTLEEALVDVQSVLSLLLTELDAAGAATRGVAQVDLVLLETQVTDLAKQVEGALKSFMQEKSTEVRQVLQMQVEQRDAIVPLLHDALKQAEEAQGSILLARDELVRYLRGEGIEEQSRNRAGRKLQGALEEIPDPQALFTESGLTFSDPFITERMQQSLMDLASRESGTENIVMQPAGESMVVEEADEQDALGDEELTASLLTAQSLPEEDADAMESTELNASVMVTTLVSEVALLLEDLRTLLTQIQGDLKNLTMTVEDIDEDLRRLARVLNEEIDRISALFTDLADEETASRLLTHFEEKSAMDTATAIADAATLSKQHGNFAPLLFSVEQLDAVVLEKQPGIPDLTSYENAFEAEYKGIPYPLP